MQSTRMLYTCHMSTYLILSPQTCFKITQKRCLIIHLNARTWLWGGEGSFCDSHDFVFYCMKTFWQRWAQNVYISSLYIQIEVHKNRIQYCTVYPFLLPSSSCTVSNSTLDAGLIARTLTLPILRQQQWRRRYASPSRLAHSQVLQCARTAIAKSLNVCAASDLTEERLERDLFIDRRLGRIGDE